jgi:hypothetical protein
MECPVCADDPTSHSFKQIETLPDGTVIMYTKPAEASKYWDRDGIIFHYDQKLPELPGTNEVMDKLNLNEQQDDQDNLFEN